MMIQVRITDNVQDYQQVAESMVSGISTIDEVAPGMIRVRYFANRFDCDGKPERIVVSDQIWSETEWLDALQTALTAWATAQPLRMESRLRLVAGMN